MAKKQKSKQYSAKVKQSEKNQSGNILKKIESIFQKNVYVYLIIILLAVIFFNKVLFSNLGLPGDEQGSAFFGKSIESPFAEKSQWNPYLGGMPLSSAVEEYTKKLVYNNLMLFLPGNYALSIYLVLLTSIAGIGMYLLLKELNLSRITAFIFGIAYMFVPVSLSLIFVGHHSKIGVVFLFPLAILALEKAMNSGKFRYFVYLGGTVALSIGTAHLQMAYFGMWMIGFYFLYKIYDSYMDKRDYKVLLKNTMFFIAAFLIAFGITARAYGPQYLYTVTESKRADTQVSGVTQEQYSVTWSLHPEEIASFVIPEFGNYLQNYWGRNAFKLNSEYFGILPVIFCFSALPVPAFPSSGDAFL